MYIISAEYCQFILFISSEQVSMGYGTITAYALMSLEARGTLFVTPGMEVIPCSTCLFATACS